MGVDMFLGEAQSQASSVRSMCQAHINGMESVKKSIATFALEQGLRGKTYDSAKAYFGGAYFTLANGIILLADAIMNAHEKFPEEYITEVDSNSLQSDILERQIQTFEQLAQNLENIPNENPIMKLATKGAVAVFRNYQREVKLKLEKLIAFNSSSVSIFSEIDVLLNDVQAGLNQVSSGKAWNASTGIFVPSAINMDWAKSISDKWEKYKFDHMTPEERFEYNLKEQYGFNEEESKLLLKLYNQLKEKYGEDADKMFWQLVASPVYTNSFKKSIMWGYTAGLDPEWRLRFYELGFSFEEMDKFEEMLWNQYQTSSSSTRNVIDFYNSMGKDIVWNELPEEEKNRYKLLWANMSGKTDFSHMAAIVSSHFHEAFMEDDAGNIIGLFGGVSGLNNSSGYVGDIAGIPGAKPSLGNDDYMADLDSINIFNRLEGTNNTVDVVNRYYEELNNGEINRAREFVTNIGNGSYAEGIQTLQIQYNEFKNSISYANLTEEERAIFAGFFLHVINDKNEMK